MIKLRAHHFLCMLNFEGKGYSESFVKNFANIINRIQNGEAITIVEGPDDVCAPLRHTEHWHCDNTTVFNRDKMARMKLNEYFENSNQPEDEVCISKIFWIELKRSFSEEHNFSAACVGCEWVDICYRGQMWNSSKSYAKDL